MAEQEAFLYVHAGSADIQRDMMPSGIVRNMIVHELELANVQELAGVPAGRCVSGHLGVKFDRDVAGKGGAGVDEAHLDVARARY